MAIWRTLEKNAVAQLLCGESRRKATSQAQQQPKSSNAEAERPSLPAQREQR